jgi:hypothetical protein
MAVRSCVVLAGAGEVYEALAVSDRSGEQREIDLKKALDCYRRATDSWERLAPGVKARASDIVIGTMREAEQSFKRLAAQQ